MIKNHHFEEGKTTNAKFSSQIVMFTILTLILSHRNWRLTIVKK